MSKFRDFPEEMLGEIMSWLPPDSLKKCKRVCKRWRVIINALITDQFFIDKHLRNMKNKLLSTQGTLNFTNIRAFGGPEAQGCCVDGRYLFTVLTDDECHFHNHIPCVVEDLKFLPCDEAMEVEFMVVSHCNGVICGHAHDMSCDAHTVFLVNLALGELKIVPRSGFSDGYALEAVGFGYDLGANDYKVITIKCKRKTKPRQYKVEVYTLRTNSWREIECSSELGFTANGECQSLYCNGVCYWNYVDMPRNIISFDVHDEVFRSILLPDEILNAPTETEVVDRVEIVIWKESLALFAFRPWESDIDIDMWVMEGDSRGVEGSYSWTKHLSIWLNMDIDRTVAFWNDVLLVMKNEDPVLFSYDLETEDVTEDLARLFSFEDQVIVSETSLVSVLKRGDM